MKTFRPPATPPLPFRVSTSGIARGAKGVPKAVRAESRGDRALFKDLNHTQVRNPGSHAFKLQNS